MFKAGVAKVKITPQPGLEMAGFGVYINRVGKEIHDDLFARAVMFDDGKGRALLITCDLCGIGRQFILEFRREIAKAVKIGENNIMISTIHTHSGPVTLWLRGWGEMDPGYMVFLREKIIEAAKKAREDLGPALVGAGKGKAEIGYNRVVQGAKTDTDLMVLRVDDLKGRTKAVLYNYSTHPVSLGPNSFIVSADWPGCASAKIDKAVSGGMAMFCQGFCGDVNVKEACQTSFEKTRAYGETLADEVLGVYKKIKPVKPSAVRMASGLVNLPLQVPDAKFVDEMMERCAEQRKQPGWGRFYSEWKEDTLKEISRNVRDTLPAEIQCLRIGKNILFVMLPGEVFTKWGLKIKKGSPAKNTFVIGYANDFVGYIPDEDDFARKGYAADMVPLICGFLHFRPGVGSVLVAGVSRLIKGLDAKLS